MNKDTSAFPSTDLLHSPPTNSNQRAQNSEYTELKQLLKQRGVLEKQSAYYIFRISLLFTLLALGVILFLTIPIFWVQLLNAIYLAFIYTQFGLLSHEAGHRQMFHRLWQHDLISLVGGTLILGVSYAWWLKRHNTHHSHPNEMDIDPDIEMPLLDFTGIEDLERIGKVRQFLVKHQAFIFLPALMMVSVGLQCNSVDFLLRKKGKYHAIECFLMIAHFVLYFALIFSHLPFWQAVLFVCTHQALTGLYLGAIFAPNHKGMAVIENKSPMDFLHRQVLTARNIHTHPLTDFCYGGLNYQIEHHLFPSMSRNKLKEAQIIVKAFCQVHAIPYHETTILQSFKEILQHLHQVGAPLRRKAGQG